MMNHPLFLIASLGLSLTLAGGCASHSKKLADKGYETPSPDDSRRDSEKAEKHNAEAVEKMTLEDYAGAEVELKAALSADVMHGPAHNNLGKVYFHQGKLYLAAWEFQYAAKLMPSVPEPRNNLGMVFESVGKLDDAVASYDEARQRGPDNVQVLGNLARARIRRGDRDESVRQLLEQLVMRETRPQWADWARSQLSTISAKPAE